MENGWLVFVLLALGALIAAGLAAGANGTAADPSAAIEKVKVGMSQSDVVDIMGIADKTHNSVVGDTHYSQWVYRSARGTCYVYFENYRVTGIQD